MSSTTSTAVAAVPTACTNLFNTPNQDNVCAMPYRDNNDDIMKQCCGDAQIVSYYNDCGIYCVALDQTIDDLRDCLFDNEAPDADVFCSGNNTTTKTQDAEVPASAQASVISGGDAEDSNDDGDDSSASATGDDASSTATGTGSSSESTSTSTETGNAAAGVGPQSGISTLGLTIGALLFSSLAAGAFQL
ncbi:hypothetical protein F66182_8452 [Fusarium sp. NRRL 66182]|nr:hypothetical protein F66182_8452 [Fusarium sp. NRRL 66182]